MAKRSSIGPGALQALDPLDALLPEDSPPRALARTVPPVERGDRTARRSRGGGGADGRPRRSIDTASAPASTSRRLPVNLSSEQLERARDAVYWTPGLTLAGLVGEALEREIARRERERGEPFPPRGGQLKRGRPIR